LNLGADRAEGAGLDLPRPGKLLTGESGIGLVRSRGSWVALAVLLVGLTGCIGTVDEELDPANADAGVGESQDYVPVDEQALSEPEHDIAPRVTDRVSVSVDGVELFVEYWLPEGEGPFPTIVHSTPYSHLDRTTQATGAEGNQDFFVPRGYAYVVADVRGFGESEGCVEVWGPNEQADQADLVEWVAQRDWSDGNVGMIGASYPGTTPMEAAVQDPEGLEAIVAVAGLTDPYYDWHYGGVPNGESGPAGSPAAYQGIGAVVPHEFDDPQAWAQATADTGCNTPQLATEAYQSDGVYTEFYEERNLTQRVDQVEAPVLYTQGFDDDNVKPSQALNWFNDLDTEKKGLFGPWGHEYPPREDWTNLTLAWFDEHLKDRDTNVTEGPTVEVHTNRDTWRPDEAFPTKRATDTDLFLDAEDALTWQAPDGGEVSFEANRADATIDSTVPAETDQADRLVFATGDLEEDAYVSGTPKLQLTVSLDGADNAFLAAQLYAVDGEDRREITYGRQNLALRNDVTSYEPVPQGEEVTASLRFQPVEHVVEAGERLELVVEPVDHDQSPTAEASQPVTVTLATGSTGTHVQLPLLEDRPDQERPEGV
jgi:putative CocE/NonD family hydrolase